MISKRTAASVALAAVLAFGLMPYGWQGAFADEADSSDAAGLVAGDFSLGEGTESSEVADPEDPNAQETNADSLTEATEPNELASVDGESPLSSLDAGSAEPLAGEFELPEAGVEGDGSRPDDVVSNAATLVGDATSVLSLTEEAAPAPDSEFAPAEGTTEVSGAIVASSFEDGAALVLVGDTTLDMDVARTFSKIEGVDYALTVTGSNAFSVEASEGPAVLVHRFEASTDVSLVGALGAINGSVSISGSADVTSTDQYGIYATGDGSTVTISGPAQIGGSPTFGVFATSDISFGSNATIVGGARGIYSLSGGVSIGGDADITANAALGSASSSIHAIICNEGVTISGDANITSTGDGIYASGNSAVSIGGSANIAAEGAFGIFCHPGAVTIGGDAEICGRDFGIQAPYSGDASGVIIGGDSIHVHATLEDPALGTGGFALYTGGPIEFASDATLSGCRSSIYNYYSGESHLKGVTATGGKVGPGPINFSSGKAVFDGDVVAETTGAAAYAIFAWGLTVNGNLTALNPEGYNGVFVPGSIEVTDNLVAEAHLTEIEDGSGGYGVAVLLSNCSLNVGGNLTVKANKGSIGVYSLGTISVKGDVETTAATKGIEATQGAEFFGNVTATAAQYGIAGGDSAPMTFHGGTVVAKATGAEDGISAGIYSNGGEIVLDGDITAEGGDYGIIAFDGGSGIVHAKAGRVEATGAVDAIRAFGGIVIDEPLEIILPVDGIVLQSTDGESEIEHIAEASGTPVSHAIISAAYKVTFDANGGEGEMDAVTVHHGDAFELPESAFTAPQCKAFDGWDLGAAGEKVTITADAKAVAQWRDAHTLEAVAEVPATCEDDGVEAYWKCSVCGALFSDEAGENAIDAPAVIPATGHEWGEWVVAKAPTTTAAGERTRTCAHDATHVETEAIPPTGETSEVSITYSFSKGDGASWTKGTSAGLDFTVNRSVDDASTYGHFTGLKVDGKQLSADSFAARSGSLNVTLKPAYLETLSDGKHAIEASFDDGSATASFTVASAAKTPAAKSSTSLPNTGDTAAVWPFALMALVALASIAAGIRVRRGLAVRR